MIKDFLSVNAKRIAGMSLLLSMMAVQTVGAAGDADDSLKSKGNIEYDADGDGKADVLFYSKDLDVIAGGIDELNVNVSNLQTAFSELSTQSNTYKAGIINAINGNVYAKQPVDVNASFEEIIDKLNSIPAPTVAYGSYYGDGNNDTLGVGIGAGVSSADVNIDGVTELNVGINESVTLPSGYYPNDITIKNGVINRGSVKIVLDSVTRTAIYEAGYYDVVDVSTTLEPTGHIVYTVNHTHQGNSSKGGACYKVTSTKTVNGGHNFVGTGHFNGSAEYQECTYCHTGGYSWDNLGGACPKNVKYVSTYGLKCELPVGEREVSDISEVVAGDKIIKAVITY